ncbi:spermine oxidase-like [Glossina fuscipes fuscipes]
MYFCINSVNYKSLRILCLETFNNKYEKEMALVTSSLVQTPQSVRVVVIGSGPSGIAAATRLMEAGFNDVLILEAESRVGGRIYTIPFADSVIDLGAQWCHGEKNNVVYETLERLNLLNLLETTGDTYFKFKCVRSNKDIVPDKVVSKLTEIFYEIIPSREDELKSYEGSAGAIMTEMFWKEIDKLAEKPDRTVVKEYFETAKKANLSLEAADTMFEVSPSNALQFETSEGDQNLNWKDKGYQTFLNLLLKTDDYKKNLGLLEDKIQVCQRVKHIEWQHEDGIKITLFSGKIIVADHVVCTTSLGVLKESHKSLFQPSLPLSKIRAIEGLKLGTVNKFFLEFEKPFEPVDWVGFNFLWLEEDLTALRETERFWLENVFGFYRVAHQPRLMQGWIVGRHARYMETLSEKEVLEALMWLLRKFLSHPVPEPIKFTRTQWYTNCNFRGTYSLRTMYTDELRTGAWDLAAPLIDGDGKPIVQFAGEATNSHHFGTVHGATESGWREADRLIHFYQKKSLTK